MTAGTSGGSDTPVYVAAPTRYIFFGVEISVHLSTDQTGGRFCLTSGIFQPGGDGGLHLHRHEDESLQILEGALSVQIGDEVKTLSTGGSCFIPRGTAHRLCNTSDQPAHVIVIHPPGNFDRFLAEVGTPADQPPTPLSPEVFARVGEACARYGTEILEPPSIG